MICMGHSEVEPFIYEKNIKKKKCIPTNNRLEMESSIYTKLSIKCDGCLH